MAVARRTAHHPSLGAHHSIAGGFHRAVERAVETGCECLQIFTRNINQWATSPIDPAAAEAFREAVRAAELRLVVAHDSYLINPASADTALRRKSIDGLAEELRRAELLGIPWVVAHPGAAGEQPVDVAVARAATGIAESLRATSGLAAGILIETTAGQGSCLGASFEEIGTMLDVIDALPGLKKRAGVCLDSRLSALPCRVSRRHASPLRPAHRAEATDGDSRQRFQAGARIAGRPPRGDRQGPDRPRGLPAAGESSQARWHPADPRNSQGGPRRQTVAGRRPPQPRGDSPPDRREGGGEPTCTAACTQVENLRLRGRRPDT